MLSRDVCAGCGARVWRREALHVATAVALASLVTGYQAAGAWLEKWLAPVIAEQRVVFEGRGPDAACWLWRFRRARTDVAFVSTDLAMIVDGDRIDGTLLIAEGGVMRYFRASRTTLRVGPSERVLCVDLRRARVRADQAVTVRATIHYQPWHGLWPLTYDLPAVTLPPAQ